MGAIEPIRLERLEAALAPKFFEFDVRVEKRKMAPGFDSQM